MIRLISLAVLVVVIGGIAVAVVLTHAVSRLCCWLGVHDPDDVVRYRGWGGERRACARCGRHF